MIKLIGTMFIWNVHSVVFVENRRDEYQIKTETEYIHFFLKRRVVFIGQMARKLLEIAFIYANGLCINI